MCCTVVYYNSRWEPKPDPSLSMGPSVCIPLVHTPINMSVKRQSFPCDLRHGDMKRMNRITA